MRFKALFLVFTTAACRDDSKPPQWWIVAPLNGTLAGQLAGQLKRLRPLAMYQAKRVFPRGAGWSSKPSIGCSSIAACAPAGVRKAAIGEPGAARLCPYCVCDG